jgi:UBX domain
VLGSGGKSLNASDSDISHRQHHSQTMSTPTSDVILALLPPESSSTSRDSDCTIMIRGNGVTGTSSGQRRFDTSAVTLKDVFAFAAYGCNRSIADMESSFYLVTQLPRKVYHSSETTLSDAGFGGGQYLLPVEYLQLKRSDF